MSDTPETDAAECPWDGNKKPTECPKCGRINPPENKLVYSPLWMCPCGHQETRNPLCREREAHNQTKRERDELLKEHSTLREIAEGAIMCASLWAGSRSSTPRKLREQLNQLNQIK
jgi:hypothetical protein